MKKIILYLFLFTCLYNIKAQNKAPFALKYLYFSTGSGGRMAGSSINTVFENQLGFSVSYNKFKDIPINQYYLPDFLNVIEGSYLNNPVDQYLQYSFRFSKMFKQGRFIQLGLEAGPSIVHYKELISYDTHKNIFGENTNIVYDKHKTVGLSIKTKIGIPLLRFAGLEFATVCNINKYKAFYGAEINFNLGKIRNKK